MKRWTSWSRKLALRLNQSLKLIALKSIRFYQLSLSFYLGGRCRFDPSCSVYAEQAFAQHDFGKALTLSLKRLAKCHPLGPYGLDPVPERK